MPSADLDRRAVGDRNAVECVEGAYGNNRPVAAERAADDVGVDSSSTVPVVASISPLLSIVPVSSNTTGRSGDLGAGRNSDILQNAELIEGCRSRSCRDLPACRR